MAFTRADLLRVHGDPFMMSSRQGRASSSSQLSFFHRVMRDVIKSNTSDERPTMWQGIRVRDTFGRSDMREKYRLKNRYVID